MHRKSTATCNSPARKCLLQTIRTCKCLWHSSGLQTIKSVESILTGAFGSCKVHESHRRRVFKYLNVTCKTSSANLVSKEWFENEAWGVWGNVLTSDSVAFKGIKDRKRLAMRQHGNVACGAFAHVSVSGIQVVYEREVGRNRSYRCTWCYTGW